MPNPAQSPQAAATPGDNELEVLEPEPVASSSESESDSQDPSESGGADAPEVAEAGGSGGGTDAEAQAAAGGSAGSPAGTPGAPGGGQVAGTPGGMDGELSESLEDFDGEMQRQITILASAAPPGEVESEVIGAAAEAEDSETGEEGDNASGGVDQTGEGPGLVLVGDPSELPPAAGETRQPRGAATSGSIEEGEMPGARSDREGSVNVAMVSSRVPPDVGDGSDDDVVARQIREAAMNEDDPVLREKLWEEYRNYKKSIR